jgi:hypothetical protein
MNLDFNFDSKQYYLDRADHYILIYEQNNLNEVFNRIKREINSFNSEDNLDYYIEKGEDVLDHLLDAVEEIESHDGLEIHEANLLTKANRVITDLRITQKKLSQIKKLLDKVETLISEL